MVCCRIGDLKGNFLVMNSLFRSSFLTLLPRSSHLVVKSATPGFSAPFCNINFDHAATRAANLEILLTRFRVQCYSSKSRKKKTTAPPPVMKEDKEAFFVVRKGGIVGVYRSLNDCQSQVGPSVCDPPVSVYKGHAMPKDTEKYLLSCGLKHALYSIKAEDLTDGLFGTLVPCPYPLPSATGGETSSDHMSKKRPHEEALWTESGRSCTLEFDGASRGNPGQAGAGAVIRADDGSLICRLREGLGIATCNAAEYRAIILGLKYALEKGFTNIRVQGDSKLVCMQIQGLWKVKNQNISILYGEAKRLKDKFLSFQIIHVLRDLNTEADEQANLATKLTDGQVQEEIDK